MAHAETGRGSVTAGTRTEAWYVTPANSACAGADCSAVPTSEYPRNTLHAGISRGVPTTATYIELDVSAVPHGATYTAGRLRLPVDIQPGDGSLRPETAKLRVCQVTGSFNDAKASLDKPPDTDCDVAALATYAAKPTPTFRLDLAPFLPGWSQGMPTALAILPAPEATKADETWHVTFFGKEYRSTPQSEPPDESPAPPAAAAPATDAEAMVEPAGSPPPSPSESPGQKSTPITAKVSFTRPAFAAPPAALLPLRVAEAELGPPQRIASRPAVGALGAPPPMTAGSPPPQAEVKPAKVPVRAPAPAAAPRWIKVGYAYPIAWLFPLLLLIGFAMTGHSLTRNLEHPERALA